MQRSQSRLDVRAVTGRCKFQTWHINAFFKADRHLEKYSFAAQWIFAPLWPDFSDGKAATSVEIWKRWKFGTSKLMLRCTFLVPFWCYPRTQEGEAKRHSQKRLWTTAECAKDPSSTSFGFDDGTHVVKRRSALAAPAAWLDDQWGS